MFKFKMHDLCRAPRIMGHNYEKRTASSFWLRIKISIPATKVIYVPPKWDDENSKFGMEEIVTTGLWRFYSSFNFTFFHSLIGTLLQKSLPKKFRHPSLTPLKGPPRWDRLTVGSWNIRSWIYPPNQDFSGEQRVYRVTWWEVDPRSHVTNCFFKQLIASQASHGETSNTWNDRKRFQETYSKSSCHNDHAKSKWDEWCMYGIQRNKWHVLPKCVFFKIDCPDIYND